MLTRRRFLILTGSAAAVGAATAAGVMLLPDERASSNGFPVIRYGEEACFHCGMIIDDPRFAAAWSAPNDERHFDDIACAIASAAEEPVATDARCYVHDYFTEAWLDAPAATYVISDEIRSPMASGVAALASAEAANELADDLGGHVFTWDALPGQLEGGHA